MDNTEVRKASAWPLLAILGVALALRVWGIWFGFPYLYHDDEPNEVIRALRLGSGSFDFSRTGKGGFFYLLFVEYGIYFLVLRALGAVGSAAEFGTLFIQNPWPFYLMGRLTSAILGTITVYLTYRIGCKAYSRTAGLLAALFLAVDYTHAQNSHYSTVDVPMTCFVAASLLFALRIRESGRLGDYLGAACFTGLAAMTKLPAVLVGLPVLVGHWAAVRRAGSRPHTLFFGRNIVLYVLIGAVVFFAGNPGFLPNLGQQLRGVASVYTGESTGEEPVDTGELREPPSFFVYYAVAVVDSVGWPLATLSVAALLYALARRTQQDALLAGFVACFYLILSLSKHPFLYYPRYILPMIPPLLVLVGRLFDAATATLFPWRWKYALAVVAGCTIVVPAVKTIIFDHQMSQTDTRTLAKEWIERTIPAGAKILIEGSRTAVIEATVPLQMSRENIQESIKAYRSSEPAKARYFELALKVLSGITYDLETVGPNKELRALSYYKAIGVEFMVLRPQVYVHHRKKMGLDLLVQDLDRDPDIVLLKRIEPHWLNRPGPGIAIYQVKGSLEAKTGP